MCVVLGPDVDDCSKYGKKAAEAMSLSKEGKSAHYHLQNVVKFVVVWYIGKQESINCSLACVCLHYCACTLAYNASMNCASASL